MVVLTFQPWLILRIFSVKLFFTKSKYFPIQQSSPSLITLCWFDMEAIFLYLSLSLSLPLFTRSISNYFISCVWGLGELCVRGSRKVWKMDGGLGQGSWSPGVECGRGQKINHASHFILAMVAAAHCHISQIGNERVWSLCDASLPRIIASQSREQSSRLWAAINGNI